MKYDKPTILPKSVEEFGCLIDTPGLFLHLFIPKLRGAGVPCFRLIHANSPRRRGCSAWVHAKLARILGASSMLIPAEAEAPGTAGERANGFGGRDEIANDCSE